ncbi:MAG: hypothetical protein JO001_20860 [Alphaproteobacteria bacterium]|nr:hypothetical protein [Alphaproteobacteria bacterium]
MRISFAAIPVILGVLGVAAPSFADSVAVTTGPNGTMVSSGKPCRVVTRDSHDSNNHATNSTSITTGPNGMSGTTTVSPGGAAGSSVTVGSGSSSDGSQASSAAGSDCVIYKDKDQ